MIGRPRICKTLQKEIKKELSKGKSTREIAKSTGVSHETVWRYKKLFLKQYKEKKKGTSD